MMNSFAMTWPFKLPNGTSYLFDDDSHWNKCSGPKRSFKEIKDSTHLEDHIMQAPPIKRFRSENHISPMNFFPWQVPSFLPLLPPSGPTYIDDIPESIFLPKAKLNIGDIKEESTFTGDQSLFNNLPPEDVDTDTQDKEVFKNIVITEVVSLADTECPETSLTEVKHLNTEMTNSTEPKTPPIQPIIDNIKDYIEVSIEGKVITKGAQLFSNMARSDHQHKSTASIPVIDHVTNTSNEPTKRRRVSRKNRKPTFIIDPVHEISCKICSVRCATRSQLVRHMQSHGANRKYRCQYCDCSYSRKDNLIGHEKDAHQN